MDLKPENTRSVEALNTMIVDELSFNPYPCYLLHWSSFNDSNNGIEIILEKTDGLLPPASLRNRGLLNVLRDTGYFGEL
jgi:hypothetical protein